MTRPRLTTFGESLLRLSTPVDDPLETTDSFDVYVGGAEGNVAVAAQRLGLDATWLSKLPRSPLGEKVTATYRTHGVETAVTWADDGRVGTYYLERGGHPRGSTVVYDRDASAITTATFEDLADDPIERADAVHVTGITPALSQTLAKTTEKLLATATDRGTKTIFDVNYRSNLWEASTAAETLAELLSLVDVLFVARRDATDVLGFEGTDAEIIAGLRETYDPELVVLTRGDEGALASDGEKTVSQPVYETETVDPIGTGDAFVGGFLASWLDGGSLETALEWGAATGALKRTIAGDLAVVRPETVESIVAGDVEGISR
ncbi:MAG: bifunctional 2-dehydro-3-deoxygluconokinase/2-dehydro-3-deoxygalactonokinase [Halorhabdus sp.]